MLNFIRDRSRNKNLDKNNRKFAPYSKSYKGSLDFKIGGKSASNVDLTLSGELLDSLDLISDTSGSLLIGHHKNDTQLNGKAEGNIKGTYGNKSQVTKGRDYLGITKKDLTEILKKYPLKDFEERMKRTQTVLGAISKASEVNDGV